MLYHGQLLDMGTQKFFLMVVMSSSVSPTTFFKYSAAPS